MFTNGDQCQTAQAEINNPMWAKAIEVIYPKAREMATKPRYWNVAFPLAITSLCVAPENYFRKHWISCFDSLVPRLKVWDIHLPKFILVLTMQPERKNRIHNGPQS
jgi:hypothetical protein